MAKPAEAEGNIFEQTGSIPSMAGIADGQNAADAALCRLDRYGHKAFYRRDLLRRQKNAKFRIMSCLKLGISATEFFQKQFDSIGRKEAIVLQTGSSIGAQEKGLLHTWQAIDPEKDLVSAGDAADKLQGWADIVLVFVGSK